MTYPNEALTSICEQLLDEWELTPEEIANLALDIAGECAGILDGREIRGWSYQDEAERRVKMLAAREFCEGWFQALNQERAA